MDDMDTKRQYKQTLRQPEVKQNRKWKQGHLKVCTTYNIDGACCEIITSKLAKKTYLQLVETRKCRIDQPIYDITTKLRSLF